jgi:3-oxoacyl-[acyl-carrier protein] reductase
MSRLDGQVALVTGASKGFGRATALLFAQEGADVVVNYRSSREEAARLVADVESLGRRCMAVQADVSDEEQARRLVESAANAFGRIDVLVNNAGVMEVKPFADQAPAAWKAMIGVNVFGSLYVTKAVLPLMIKQRRGSIINLASQLGHVGGENFAVYSGTKGFVLAYTKSLAREVGPYGIRVNSVCPGSIVTDMNLSIFPPDRQAQKAKELPLRHMGAPIDVAYAALYLAADDSKFMTGQCVDVNGGSTMA